MHLLFYLPCCRIVMQNLPLLLQQLTYHLLERNDLGKGPRIKMRSACATNLPLGGVGETGSRPPRVCRVSSGGYLLSQAVYYLLQLCLVKHCEHDCEHSWGRAPGG